MSRIFKNPHCVRQRVEEPLSRSLQDLIQNLILPPRTAGRAGATRSPTPGDSAASPRRTGTAGGSSLARSRGAASASTSAGTGPLGQGTRITRYLCDRLHVFNAQRVSQFAMHSRTPFCSNQNGIERANCLDVAMK